MKYIKPTDFVSVREFQAKYKRIEDDITELLTTDGSARTADELNKKLNTALNAAVSYLSRVNAKYAKDELSRAFNEGKGQTDEPPKRTVAEVNEILSAQGFRYAKNAFSQNTYIELQQSMQAAGKDLTHRVNGIIKRLAKTGDDSIYNVQQAIVSDLQQNGVLTVEYKNGAKQPISSYAAMAARSARIESTNIGAIGRALQAGTDLVKMTTMPQCCKLCGAYQDKVYSISGKDKRFPALFKTVLSRGYALPHPNCRHEFIPYFAEIEDPADVEQMIKKSQIKYDSKGNLVDVRWQKDIEAYAQWQAGNRQRNDELHEYERMKEYYAGRESEMPYKTLASFRTARRRDELSPAFKAWRYRKADAKQYEEWKAILGVENMPKTLAKFQEIKYNKDTQDRYTRLEKTFQGYSVYKRENQDCTPSDYRTALKLKGQGVKGTIHIPPQTVDTKKYIYNDEHINTERQHGISRAEAESYIGQAVVSITQWKGQRIAFYSKDGVTVVDLATDKIVTSWRKDEFDDNVKSIIKEIIGSGEE